jgi:thioredoxin-like negative regulator of GroEL
MAALVFRGGGAPSGVQPVDGTGAPAKSQGPDPVAAYADALAAGRPIYVLFHSSSCPSCIEITQYSVDARPDYEGSVTFVDVLTDDPRARPLFSEFNFQYIPTLFFLAPDGSVIEQHTGPLAEEDLRQTLDGLAATAAGAGGS